MTANYKGKTSPDSGSVYCPYIPLYTTKLMNDYRHKQGFDIMADWGFPTTFLQLFKPWKVLEYTFDGWGPIETRFRTKKQAEQFVMLKKLEQ